MTKEERAMRARCPYVELVGGMGYVCNNEKISDDRSVLAHTPMVMSGVLRMRKKCFGCAEMRKYVRL